MPRSILTSLSSARCCRLGLVVLLMGSLGCEANKPASTPAAVAPRADGGSGSTGTEVSGAVGSMGPSAPTAAGAAAGVTASDEPAAVQLTETEVSEGWLQLFDGETLFGWQPRGNVDWQVVDGKIRATTGETGLLVTSSNFDNYQFRCDFRIAGGGNSGVFFRTPPVPKNPAVDCYELNICDVHPAGFNSGSLVSRQQTAEPHPTDGGWHHFDALLDGPSVQVWLDGDLVLDYQDEETPDLSSGRIGLQFREGAIEFKNVFVRPLGFEPWFNGQDLTGWRVVPGSQGEFQAVDGIIQITGGRGFLESEPTFADGILLFTARTNGDNLNGGVFFRTQTGTAEQPSNGYEFQIHNGVKQGDRKQPVDFGTGAIFRRQPARRVVSDDHKWFTGVLIAEGDHFATWVNGIQVVDWRDERADSTNPREGRSLAAGHLSLQAHDPTTNLSFRQVLVRRRDAASGSPAAAAGSPEPGVETESTPAAQSPQPQ